MKRWNSSLEQRTPLRAKTRLKLKGFHLKQTPLRKVSDKQKIELRKRSKLKAELIKQAPKDRRGIPLCSECGKPVDWDWRSPSGDLSHEVKLSQGGLTETKNGKILCRNCHNTKRHNLREILY